MRCLAFRPVEPGAGRCAGEEDGTLTMVTNRHAVAQKEAWAEHLKQRAEEQVGNAV